MRSAFYSYVFLPLLLMIGIGLGPCNCGKLLKNRFYVEYVSGSPDGVYKDKILSINGQFPGPTIEGEVGDILEVEVVNGIQDGQNVTIHWHGIHQKGSICEDGTAQISQCPLKNGFSQIYTVPLEQAGTYWYHSHVKSQYTEGLWGILVVHGKEEPYKYDAEIVITLNDWYHRTAHENEVWHLLPISRGVPPYPDSGLLNGLGRYPCNFASLQGRSCHSGGQNRTLFRVKKDRTYRLRVINTSAVAAFNFSIDGHQLETIEVDGVYVKRGVVVDVASLAAAQRYSFLVRTKESEPSGRYLIRVPLRTDYLMLINNNVTQNINKYPEALIADITGVLEYDDTPNPHGGNLVEISSEPHSWLDLVPPKDTEKGTLYLDEMDLSPLDGIYAPDHVDQRFVLEVDFFEDHEDIRRGSFNRTPFVLPDHKPLLITLLEGEPIPEEAFPLRIEYNNVIEVVINNPFYGPHPFHLHGHHFWVLGIGALEEGDYAGQPLKLDGVRRDTVLVQELSWAVIRFVADNPGIWTFHCHIDWHNLSGMALTFVEAREIALAKATITEESKRVCGMWK